MTNTRIIIEVCVNYFIYYEIVKMTTKEWLWVMIERASPIHTWHESVKQTMIRDWWKDCMAVLWSINEKLSWRHMFSYKERAKFINMIFPELLVQWIPDFDNDDDWIFTLDQIIKSRYDWDIKNVVFYWWCDEDIAYLLDRGRKCKIVNRFDGINSPKISATEIRDILHKWNTINDINRTKNALAWKVNPIIQDQLIALFNEKLIKLKKI